MKNIPLPSMGTLTKREFLMLCVVLALHVVAIVCAFSRFADFAYSDKIPNSSITVELRADSPRTMPELDHIAPVLTAEKALSENVPAPKVPAQVSATHPISSQELSHELSSPLVSRTPSIASQGATPLAPYTTISPDRVRISLPPSAKLLYKAQSFQAGKHTTGSGTLFWQTTGNTFSIQGEFDIPLISSLSFSSEGLIDPDSGISPLIYSEKRQNGQPLNISFQRDLHNVLISNSSQARDLRVGEQDCASVIWQLVRMGRLNSEIFFPGSQFELPVATEREAVAWQIQVIGQEEIDSPIGKLKTWHIVHTPLPSSTELVLDIWLAEEKEWYPVKLRYTDATKDYSELLISEIFSTPNR